MYGVLLWRNWDLPTAVTHRARIQEFGCLKRVVIGWVTARRPKPISNCFGARRRGERFEIFMSHSSDLRDEMGGMMVLSGYCGFTPS